MEILLESLKKEDFVLYSSIINAMLPGLDTRNYYIIQGMTQDAISSRGWSLMIFATGGCWKKPHAMISDGERAPVYAEAGSPAEALLAAYVEAMSK